jgi:hypothetical protein
VREAWVDFAVAVAFVMLDGTGHNSHRDLEGNNYLVLKT